MKVKIDFKFLKWVCEFHETPNDNELYGKKFHDRCFYNTTKWDESIVCRHKNCPLINN